MRYILLEFGDLNSIWSDPKSSLWYMWWNYNYEIFGMFMTRSRSPSLILLSEFFFFFLLQTINGLCTKLWWEVCFQIWMKVFVYAILLSNFRYPCMGFWRIYKLFLDVVKHIVLNWSFPSVTLLSIRFFLWSTSGLRGLRWLWHCGTHLVGKSFPIWKEGLFMTQCWALWCLSPS